MKLLGKFIGFLTIKGPSKTIGRPLGGIDVVDVGNDFFMVKIDFPKDDFL